MRPSVIYLIVLLLAGHQLALGQARSGATEVGEWLSFGTFGPEEAFSLDPTVAIGAGAKGVLTVWSERVDGRSRIVAHLREKKFLLDMGEANALRPDVAYDPIRDRFLVAWLGSDLLVRATVLDGTTGERLVAPLVVDGPQSVRDVSLAAGGGGYLLVWQQTDRKGASEVFSVPISGDNAMPLHQPVQLSTTGGYDADPNFDAVSPDVIFEATRQRFVVVWAANGGPTSEAPTGFVLKAREVSPDGSPVSSTSDLTEETAGDVRWPAVAPGAIPGAFYAVWTRQVAAEQTRFAIEGMEVVLGETTLASPETLSDSRARGLRPSVEWVGTAGVHVVAWENRDADGSRSIRARLRGGDFFELPEVAGIARRPVLSGWGDGVQVSWAETGAGVAVYSESLGIGEPVPEVPAGTLLAEAYPNPFTSSARITVGVAEDQHVDVVVFDMLGREVWALFSGLLRSNDLKTLTIYGSGLPSGTYMIQVRGRSVVENVHLVRVR